MRDLYWMILRDKSPGSSRGGGQLATLSNLGPLTGALKYNNSIASVWHEYCSDAVCPTIMDWQAR